MTIKVLNVCMELAKAGVEAGDLFEADYNPLNESVQFESWDRTQCVLYKGDYEFHKIDGDDKILAVNRALQQAIHNENGSAITKLIELAEQIDPDTFCHMNLMKLRELKYHAGRVLEAA